MTAQLHSLPRSGTGGPEPFVPALADVRDAPDFRFNIARMLDSDWYHSCSKEEALAGINLHARAIHQVPAGSLPSSDALLARLADYGRDVEGWLLVKARALEGWVLCSDGRWYQPDVARNALHIWIGRLEKRRASAFANQKQSPDRDFGMNEIEADLETAAVALRAIDPQDPVLREATARMARWRAAREKAAIASSGPALPEPDPSRTPTRVPSRTPQGGYPQDSSAQLSTKDSSSDLRSEDSRRLGKSQQEFELGEGAAPGTPVPKSKVVPPWPPDPVAQLKAVYPRWENPGDVEKALIGIRRGGKVPFEAIIVGAARLAGRGLDPQYIRYPAKWLKGRGWENDPDPPARAGPGQPPRASPGNGWVRAVRTVADDHPYEDSP